MTVGDVEDFDDDDASRDRDRDRDRARAKENMRTPPSLSRRATTEGLRDAPTPTPTPTRTDHACGRLLTHSSLVMNGRFAF